MRLQLSWPLRKCTSSFAVRRYCVLIPNRYKIGFRLSGVIYIHHASGNHSDKTPGHSFNMFRKICGESTLDDVVIITNTRKDDLQATRRARGRELHSDSSEPTLDGGSRIVQYDDTAESAHVIIRMIVAGQPIVLRIQRELVDENNDIVDTIAGKTIGQELDELIRRCQRKETDIRDVARRSSSTTAWKRKMWEELRLLQQHTAKIEKDFEGMSAGYVAEKERMEARVKEMAGDAKERQWPKAQHDRQLTDPDHHHLQGMVDVSASDRKGLKVMIGSTTLSVSSSASTVIPATQGGASSAPSLLIFLLTLFSHSSFSTPTLQSANV